MPDQPKCVPAFASEEEELAFWDEHDIADFDDGPADDIVWDIRRPVPKRRLNLRLDPSLLVQLKDAAATHDMAYQSLVRGLIRRGLGQLRHAA